MFTFSFSRQKINKMKNSTMSLLLSTMCIIGQLITGIYMIFIGVCIFTATCLILEELEKNNNK